MAKFDEIYKDIVKTIDEKRVGVRRTKYGHGPCSLQKLYRLSI